MKTVYKNLSMVRSFLRKSVFSFWGAQKSFFDLKKLYLAFGGVWPKLGHFHTFFIFFLLCSKSCKSAKKFFSSIGGRVPPFLKVKIFWHIRGKLCETLKNYRKLQGFSLICLKNFDFQVRGYPPPHTEKNFFADLHHII